MQSHCLLSRLLEIFALYKTNVCKVCALIERAKRCTQVCGLFFSTVKKRGALVARS